MSFSPLFSVIIPTYHRNESLAQCLDCLAPGVQSLPAHQYEVIVSDDGSETTAQEMIQERYTWVKWVAGPRKGPASNRNNGAKYARGKWLVFTDDDCLPDNGWLAAYAEAITREALALEGAIHPLGNPNQDLAECPVNLSGGCFWSANIAVERVLFEKIKGFDPNYPLPAHEDQDLKLRLFPFTKILFISDARVEHPVRLIPLREAITRIPIRCAAFAYHAQKNKHFLNYERKYDFIASQYKFHIYNLIKNLTLRYFKELAITILMLGIGVPLNILYFYVIEYL